MIHYRNYKNIHSVKSVQKQSFFWSAYSRTRAEYGDLLTSVNLRIQSEYWKTPYLDTFHAVFEEDNFRQDLRKKLLKFDATNAPLSKFNDFVLSVVDRHTSKK